MADLFDAVWLHETGWFEQALQVGNYIWTPSPAAALDALNQLCNSKRVRPESAHVFIVPALLTYRWRRKLRRIADVVFTIPVGCNWWSSEQHKPVIVGLILPFFDCRPWQFKRDRAAVDAFTRKLQGLWASDPALVRKHLRELWIHARNNVRM
ncbi:hypothetical protein ACA910_007975 [Epithemia clementina (nom. ined.)]